MKYSYSAKFFAMSSIISTIIFAGNLEVSQDSIFVSSPSDLMQLNDSAGTTYSTHHQDKECLLSIIESVVLRNEGTFGTDAEVRRRGAFLLTGIIVYQTTRVLGHASIWVAAGTSVVGGFMVGGPAVAGAAYLNAVATIGPASAAVETASLVIGTAASWIPGLP